MTSPAIKANKDGVLHALKFVKKVQVISSKEFSVLINQELENEKILMDSSLSNLLNEIDKDLIKIGSTQVTKSK